MLLALFYKLSNPNITFYDLLPGGPFKPIKMNLGKTLIWERRVATAAGGVFHTDYIYIALVQNAVKTFKNGFLFFESRSLYVFN